jgi:hypothetical protein
MVPLLQVPLGFSGLNVTLSTFEMFEKAGDQFTSIEGVGVTPDIVCQKTVDDLLSNGDHCLAMAVND